MWRAGLVAFAALRQHAAPRGGVLAAVHEGHRPVVGGALHEAARLLGRPVGMVLRWDHERALPSIAGTELDLIHQLRRGFCAVGDDEQPPGGGL
jgi:hypothetical protein